MDIARFRAAKEGTMADRRRTGLRTRSRSRSSSRSRSGGARRTSTHRRSSQQRRGRRTRSASSSGRATARRRAATRRKSSQRRRRTAASRKRTASSRQRKAAGEARRRTRSDRARQQQGEQQHAQRSHRFDGSGSGEGRRYERDERADLASFGVEFSDERERSTRDLGALEEEDDFEAYRIPRDDAGDEAEWEEEGHARLSRDDDQESHRGRPWARSVER
jgi:hypothetical protein